VSGLKILYLGAEGGTSLDRANAYRRLGHRVDHFDPRLLLPRSPWVDRVIWRLGAAFVSPWLCDAIGRRLQGQTYDLCHVDNGECVTPSVIGVLRKHCAAVINYNIDDPYGPRDRRRFSAYRSAVPHYDLVVVCRALNVPEARALGARQVLCVHRSADELSHAPQAITEEERAGWASEVLFLGTWMPERGPFLLELLRLGVPLTVRGSNWHAAPEWARIAPVYKGPGLLGADYAKAIQCARVNLGLLSKGNRDLHTTRSLEIPALGSLLCAERTSEHQAMYEEGVEAVFWSSAEECAAQCRALLADDQRRAAIAQAGQRRIRANRHFNEAMLAQVLATLHAVPAARTCPPAAVGGLAP